MRTADDKILCHTPTPGKQGARIDRWKYELVRDAILNVVPAEGAGVAFKDLPDLVAGELSAADRARLGSLTWYTTTVKLDLEVRGELERLAGASPQRLRRTL